VAAGESPAPPALIGRAERLLAINRALSDGLETSANGKPERIRQVVDEIHRAIGKLPASDSDLITGWLKLADVGLHATEPSELNMARSLANRRWEAAARYDVVLRKLRGAA
jgi:hypothetical protein